MVEVLWHLGSQPVLFKDALDFLAGEKSDLSDAVVVSEDNSELRLSESLLGVLYDESLDIFGG
jgi:hypothetical protein